jgi:hypothetical protein
MNPDMQKNLQSGSDGPDPAHSWLQCATHCPHSELP